VLLERGRVHRSAGRLEQARPELEEAVVRSGDVDARRRQGKDDQIRVARWMVGWAPRHLGRTDEALALQRELRAELDAVGQEDRYVDEEIALLEQDATGA
jgi:hypothetical protein